MGDRHFGTDEASAAEPDKTVDVHHALHGDSWGPAGAMILAADKTQKHGDGVRKLAGAGPRGDQPATKAEQLLQDAVATFQKSPDATGMTAAEPKFKAAIQQADTDYDKTVKTLTTEMTAAKPEFNKAMQKRQATQIDLAKSVQGLPPAEGEKVAALINAWAAVDGKDPVRKAVEDDLKKYPGLTDKLKAADAADKDPMILKGEAWKKQYETALGDKAETRLIYGGGLEAVGRKDESANMLSEAAKILGLPEPPKQPRPRGMLEA